jgi:hypothetical protein
MKTKYVAVALGLWMLTGSIAVSAQACPNWSPKFDKVTNREVLTSLKKTNWDQAFADGGPAAAIAACKVTLKDAQQRLENAAEAARDTAASGGTLDLDAVTWADCTADNTRNNALGAAECEYLNMKEMILVLEGTIGLAQCRLDHP